MEWGSYICVWFAIYKFVYHSFTEYSVTWHDSVYSIQSVAWNETHTYVCDSLYTDLWITHLLYIVWHGMSHSMSHYSHVTLYKWGVHEPHSKTLIPCHCKESPDTKPSRDLLYLPFHHGMRQWRLFCNDSSDAKGLFCGNVRLFCRSVFHIWRSLLENVYMECLYTGLFSYM